MKTLQSFLGEDSGYSAIIAGKAEPSKLAKLIITPKFAEAANKYLSFPSFFNKENVEFSGSAAKVTAAGYQNLRKIINGQVAIRMDLGHNIAQQVDALLTDNHLLTFINNLAKLNRFKPLL